MKYFSRFPLISYSFDGGDEAFYTRNVFVRLKFLDYLQEHENLFEYYVIRAYDRPDAIAHKVYGNSHLHWVILMANDVIDPKEWLLDSRSLDSYVKSKYDNPLGDSHTIRNGVVADLRAAQIALNVNPFRTVDSDPNTDAFDVVDPAAYYTVSNYEHEDNINDAKRVIRIVKPDHVNAFLKEVDEKLKAA